MKHLVMILFTAVICFSFGCSSGDDGIKVITVSEFAESAKQDTASVILDVRTAEEYSEGHIEGALNLNIKNAAAFDNGVKTLDKNKTYYIYCRSGRRSHNAALKMQKQGFKVFDMKGGINAWKEANMPVEVSTKSEE